MLKIFNSYSGLDLSLDAEKTIAPMELMHAVSNLEAGLKLLDYEVYVSGNYLDLFTPDTPYGDYILVQATQINDHLLQISANGVVSEKNLFIHVVKNARLPQSAITLTHQAHIEKLESFLKDALQSLVITMNHYRDDVPWINPIPYTKDQLYKTTRMIIESGWIATNHYAIDAALRHAENHSFKIGVYRNYAAGILIIKYIFADMPSACIDIPLMPIVLPDTTTYQSEQRADDHIPWEDTPKSTLEFDFHQLARIENKETLPVSKFRKMLDGIYSDSMVRPLAMANATCLSNDTVYLPHAVVPWIHADADVSYVGLGQFVIEVEHSDIHFSMSRGSSPLLSLKIGRK